MPVKFHPSFPDFPPHGDLPVNNHFDDTEWLYRRVSPRSWPKGGTVKSIALDAIEMPDMSVNRGLYGEPEWVIDGDKGWGAVKFQVRHVPRLQAAHGVKAYDFVVRHVPLNQEQQYPHSEIQAFDAGVRVPEPEFDDEIDLLWRERHRKFLVHAIEPDHEAYGHVQAEIAARKAKRSQ